MVKNLPANAGDSGSVPGEGRPPGRENGNPLQYSCLEIPWTEEPGGLQFLWSQRVGHDRVTVISMPELPDSEDRHVGYSARKQVLGAGR